MRFLLILIPLLSFTACGKKSSSDSKNCTYNDKPVDCSTVDPLREGKSFTLISKVKTGISAADGKIETLENTEHVESKTRNGYVYDCKASTTAGNIFDYKVNGKSLQLKLNNEIEVFTRENAVSNSYEGTWKHIFTDQTGSTTVNIIFTKHSMDITIECFYK